MAYLPVVLGLIVLGAGVVKGFTGFGGSLIMAPLFSLVMSPSQTLGTVVVVNLVTAWQMLGPSWRAMRRRVVLPMSAACALATPLGVAAVLILDPTLVRRTIGVAVLVSGLALLGGWQRVNPPRLLGTIAVGVVGGLLTGLSGMGGPPAALWLLSGRDGPARDRAGLIVYVALTQAAAVLVAASAGALGIDAVWRALWLAPLFVGGAMAGARLFHGAPERWIRLGTVALIVTLGLVTAIH